MVSPAKYCFLAKSYISVVGPVNKCHCLLLTLFSIAYFFKTATESDSGVTLCDKNKMVVSSLNAFCNKYILLVILGHIPRQLVKKKLAIYIFPSTVLFEIISPS